MGGPAPVEGVIPELPILQYIILNLIQQHGPIYGWKITVTCNAQISRLILISPGTLYSALKKMEVKGWIVDIAAGQPRKPVSEDERTRYYRITPLGETVLQASQQAYAFLAALYQAPVDVTVTVE